MEPEQLDQALQMLTKECTGKSFGIDLIIPEQYVGHEDGKRKNEWVCRVLKEKQGKSGKIG
jgi:hypothetical protein